MLRGIGSFLRITGQLDEAIKLTKFAVDRDPSCGICLYNLMSAQTLAGNYDAAEATSRKRLEFAKGGQISLGRIMLLKGDPQAALELFDRQKDDRIYWLGATALAYHTLGQAESFEEAIRELEAIDDPRAYRALARAHAWAGNIDAAFAGLERFVTPGVLGNKKTMSSIIWDPFVENLQSDPRWTALREKAGLSAARLANIRLDTPE